MIATRISAISKPFKQHLLKLPPRGSVQVSPPMGTFCLNDDPDEFPIMVAAGVGITTFRSMIMQMHLTKNYKPFYLVYAAKTAAELAFKAVLARAVSESAGCMTTYMLDDFKAKPGLAITKGPLTAEKLFELEPAIKDCPVYLSGAQGVIEPLTTGLKKLGLKDQQIKLDYFPGYNGL